MALDPAARQCDANELKRQLGRWLRARNVRGQILCIVGPPGVGKTSLGRSIAAALGREFAAGSEQALRRGDEIIVQVLKEGVGTKGPTLTSYLSIPGRFLVMMPNMDGVTALGLLRARAADTGRHTPVLMVTAHAMTGDRERFLAAGADGYVSKPLSPDELCKEIDRVVAQARTGA